MWTRWPKNIRKVAKETHAEIRDCLPKRKESWFLTANVCDKVKVKRKCYEVGSLGKNAENWRKYKVSKKETKNEVS